MYILYVFMREERNWRHTSMACLSEEEILWIWCSWITRNVEFEGCEIEAYTEEETLERRKGLSSVFLEGLHKFGGIIKKPWLHTAFSKLKLPLHSPRCNRKFILSSFNQLAPIFYACMRSFRKKNIKYIIWETLLFAKFTKFIQQYWKRETTIERFSSLMESDL